MSANDCSLCSDGALCYNCHLRIKYPPLQEIQPMNLAAQLKDIADEANDHQLQAFLNLERQMKLKAEMGLYVLRYDLPSLGYDKPEDANKLLAQLKSAGLTCTIDTTSEEYPILEITWH